METIFDTSLFIGNSIFVNSLKVAIKNGLINDCVDMVIMQTIDNKNVVVKMLGIQNVINAHNYWLNVNYSST